MSGTTKGMIIFLFVVGRRCFIIPETLSLSDVWTSSKPLIFIASTAAVVACKAIRCEKPDWEISGWYRKEIKEWNARRQRLEVGSLLTSYATSLPEKHFMSPKWFVSEVNRISRVAERSSRVKLLGEAFRNLWTWFFFKRPSSECSAITAPSNGVVKLVFQPLVCPGHSASPRKPSPRPAPRDSCSTADSCISDVFGMRDGSPFHHPTSCWW